ncbi:MAG TPA: hypothetical protein VKS79_02470 [Gemmataceae bacterium]|nr:hypothetical protein [Gemmataceae bacterium]
MQLPAFPVLKPIESTWAEKTRVPSRLPRKEDGKRSVKCLYKKNEKEVGSFHGEDYKYGSDSVLRFRQVFDQKPVGSWADNIILGCIANKDRLQFRWQNPGKAAGPFTTLTRVKE